MSAIDRIRRLRFLAWVLDEAVTLPGGIRIGLDPLIGLLPGLGDVVGAAFASFIVVEGARLGAPVSVVLRMIVNVALDTLIGSIPILGDLFDAGYKANLRNIALLERYHADPAATRNSSRVVVFSITAVLLGALLCILTLPVLLVVGLVGMF